MDPKICLPDVLGKFIAYRLGRGAGAWGSLHVVLDDGNHADAFCDEWLEQHAISEGDEDGAELARLLKKMSRTQRSKLARLVDQTIDGWYPKREAK